MGLTIDPAPKDGNARCTSTLEKLAALGLVLHYLDVPIDRARLWESMLDVMPRQLKTQALALRDMTNGSQPKLVALAAMTLYNRRQGKKILVSTNTFGATARNAHSAPQRTLKAVSA